MSRDRSEKHILESRSPSRLLIPKMSQRRHQIVSTTNRRRGKWTGIVCFLAARGSQFESSVVASSSGAFQTVPYAFTNRRFGHQLTMKRFQSGPSYHAASNTCRSLSAAYSGRQLPFVKELLDDLKIKPRQVSYQRHIKRVLCVSDIHTDHDDNLRWAENLDLDFEALLIVAGDISHDISVVRKTFEILTTKFGAVAYTPGNHCLWVDSSYTRKSDDGDSHRSRTYEKSTDSIHKLAVLLKMCDDMEIYTGPIRVGGGIDDDDENFGGDAPIEANKNKSGLWVVPLLSWHHQSFDTEPDIDPDAWGRIPSVERLVADYRRAQWPEPLSPRDDSVAQFMDTINDYVLPHKMLPLIEADKGSAALLTFSHFLPRIELIPEKRYMSYPTLNKAVGSNYLERRLRQLGSSFHVFGHTHFGWDMTIDGVRYVQASLAYPKEWRYRSRSLTLGTMTEEHGYQPVCVWEEESEDSHNGGFPPNVLGGYWSDRYYHVDRNPNIVDALPPWNANRFKRLDAGRVEDFEKHNSTRFSRF